MTRPDAPLRSRLWPSALALALIVLATLLPGDRTGRRSWMWCLTCDEHGGVDFALNVALFLPLGFTFAYAGWSVRRTTLVALGITLAIELLQLTAIPGRDPSLRDVVANTAGAWIGAMSQRIAGQRASMTTRDASLLLRASAIVWLVVVSATSWATTLSLPATRYFGQIAPELAQFAKFQGDVIRASVADRAIEVGEIADSRGLRAAILQHGARVTATVKLGAEPSELAPIVAIFDEQQREILVLGQSRQSAEFRVRLGAGGAHLRVPILALRSAFASADPGDTVIVSGEYARGVATIAASSHGVEHADRITLGPGIGWSFLLPFEHEIGPVARGLSSLWLLVLTLPLGYFRSRLRGNGGSVWIAAVLLVGLVVVPFVVRAAPGGLPEWLGASMGIVAGLAIGWRRQKPRIAGFGRGHYLSE